MSDKAKNLEELDKEKKWIWKMDYCREQRIPPAQKWAWDKAEEAYIKKLTHSHNLSRGLSRLF